MQSEKGETGKTPILNYLQIHMGIGMIDNSLAADIISALSERGVYTLQNYIDFGTQCAQPGGSRQITVNMVIQQYAKRIRAQQMDNQSRRDVLFFQKGRTHQAMATARQLRNFNIAQYRKKYDPHAGESDQVWKKIKNAGLQWRDSLL